MKIRELRLKNLNSLYGEWEIDFSSQAYQESGIFLISGPTGAGKTTVLDAICLALYGKTPRLQSINSSANEIMSRHTADCYAEVVFETSEGLYQSRWSQRRAKSRADGNLQAQKREISEWNPEKSGFDLLETYTSRVDEVVQEKTGMNFGRFTRSMMLAQGQFAAFLEAKDDDRSETLEQITGTEIYSRISRGVFERHKAEKEKLEVLEKAVDNISQLSDDQFFELEIEKSEKDRIITAQQKDVEAIQTQQEWLRTIGTLRLNLDENATSIKDHEESLDEFTPQRKILTEAEKAASVAVPYEKLKSLRDQVARDRELLSKANRDLKSDEVLAEKEKTALSDIEKQRKAHSQVLAKELETIKEVRKLDLQIKAAEETLAKVDQQIEAGKQEIGKVEVELVAVRKQDEQSQRELKAHRDYLSEHERDEKLVSDLPVLREQFGQWRKAGEAVEKLKAELPALQKKLAGAEETVRRKAKELKSGETLLSDLKNQLAQQEDAREKLLGGTLPRELKKEEETLEEKLRLEEKIINLEKERSRLAAGDPCPLCGSTEHPFTEGHLPELSATRNALKAIREKLGKIEDIKEISQKLSDERAKQDLALERIKSESGLCEQELKSLGKQIADLENTIKKEAAAAIVFLAAIRKSLAPFGTDDDTEVDIIFQDLKSREEAWKHHEKEVKCLADSSRETGEQIAGLAARVKALEEAQAKTISEAKTHDGTLLGHRSNRVQSFAEKDPEAEEKRLRDESDLFETSEKKASEALNQANRKVAEGNKIIEDLSGRLKDNEPKLKESNAAFEECLTRHSFANEAAFLEKNLPSEEFEALKNKAAGLDNRTAQLKAVGDDLKSKLAGEEKKQLTKKSIKELEEQKAPLIAKNRELAEQIGLLTARLKLEEENRDKKKARLHEFAEQRTLYLPWKKLNQLIGSADGKRYRNFAQGLTFEVMVGHANHQLAKMTDRYLLQRDDDPAKSLTLNVVDHYQGGEVRPTTNLSGGETFLVSLALALGLSQMASDQVRVDSLFLDEGFGTLDEETLEEALDALANLKKEEKLIGVISHVPALKERLSVQLLVERKSGGKSILAGPGVSISTES